MAPTYPDVARRLLVCCSAYRAGVDGLESLKSAVWGAATEISIPQERELREFLQRAEGRLDMIQFTVDAENIREETFAVVAEIEARLLSYLAEEET